MAIVTATVFAVFGLPYRHYQCWFSFSKPRTIIGTILYFLLAGAIGGGGLGWLVATVAMAKPTPNPLINGVLFGIGGALALRADFAAGPKPETATDQFVDARSALTLGIKWTTSLLDDMTARSAETWLMGLSDDQLASEALRVQADISLQPDTVVTDQTKNELFERLVPAMEQLVDEAHRATGRAHLITFCTRYYTEHHLAKTPVVANSAGRTPGLKRRKRVPQRVARPVSATEE